MSKNWRGRLPPDVGVVVTAAGRGERMGGGPPKQFRELGGVPLLLRALGPFLARPDVAHLVVVLPAESAAAPPEWLHGMADARVSITAGGRERMDSVEAGLRALPPSCRVVLVHDGARPFPDPGVIEAVIGHARAGAGALAAVPLADTLKEALPGTPARVRRTVPREGLWRAQTPQGFPRPLLEAAYRAARSAGYSGTDEAALVERHGGEVRLVPDAATNLKVTTPADLALAAAIAGRAG